MDWPYALSAAGELPPRARRIPGHGCCIAHNQGTTSACAENTIEDDAGVAHAGNYLRVRGEYRLKIPVPYFQVELPPRARRIRGAHAIRVSQPGTTSACAENTCASSYLAWGDWNYLRVRGEYRLKIPVPYFQVELPPRARRIRHDIIFP